MSVVQSLISHLESVYVDFDQLHMFQFVKNTQDGKFGIYRVWFTEKVDSSSMEERVITIVRTPEVIKSEAIQTATTH